jgi:hypothetical protein
VLCHHFTPAWAMECRSSPVCWLHRIAMPAALTVLPSCADAAALRAQLGVDGVFADYIEGLVFYYRFRRQNSTFPRRQVPHGVWAKLGHRTGLLRLVSLATLRMCSRVHGSAGRHHVLTTS